MIRAHAAPMAATSAPAIDSLASWWIICRVSDRRVETLTTGRGDRRLLPVFCFEEEARMFLKFDGLALAGWRVWKSGPGELASILCGPLSCVRGVSLDPLPVALDGGAVMDLARVDRETFVRRLLSRGRRTAGR